MNGFPNKNNQLQQDTVSNQTVGVYFKPGHQRIMFKNIPVCVG
jgi:hypothetical protein